MQVPRGSVFFLPPAVPSTTFVRFRCLVSVIVGVIVSVISVTVSVVSVTAFFLFTA